MAQQERVKRQDKYRQDWANYRKEMAGRQQAAKQQWQEQMAARQ